MSEREHWAEVIRRTNGTIDELNRQADVAKTDRDKALDDLSTAAGKVEIVAIPVEVAAQCDLPDAARKALNAINVRRKP